MVASIFKTSGSIAKRTIRAMKSEQVLVWDTDPENPHLSQNQNIRKWLGCFLHAHTQD